MIKKQIKHKGATDYSDTRKSIQIISKTKNVSRVNPGKRVKGDSVDRRE